MKQTTGTRIPLNDLKRSVSTLMPQIRNAIDGVIAGGSFVLGSQVAAFETAFATFCGVPHCVGVANGTDALELSLRALDCGPGNEVVTVANAGMYASSAIIAVGAHPVFADIDPATMTMAPEALSRCFGPKTRAVIVTHLYGRLADMDALAPIAAQYNVPIIEDCAQAHGAASNDKRAGSFGTLGCFSFYPTKNLGALGDGGAIVTNNAELAEALRSLRQYGWQGKYRAQRPHGRNSRLDELQAAILLAKLPFLDSWNARRRQIIARYRAAAPDTIVIPDAGPDHAAHLCVVRLKRREQLRASLEKANIATEIHYPLPDYLQPALASIVSPDFSLPVTEKVMEEILTIPCFPELTGGEIGRICDVIGKVKFK